MAGAKPCYDRRRKNVDIIGEHGGCLYGIEVIDTSGSGLWADDRRVYTPGGLRLSKDGGRVSNRRQAIQPFPEMPPGFY